MFDLAVLMITLCDKCKKIEVRTSKWMLAAGHDSARYENGCLRFPKVERKAKGCAGANSRNNAGRLFRLVGRMNSPALLWRFLPVLNQRSLNWTVRNRAGVKRSHLPTRAVGVVVPRFFNHQALENLGYVTPNPQAPHLSQPKPPSRTLTPSREDRNTHDIIGI